MITMNRVNKVAQHISQSNNKRVAIIVGAGDATGSALARKFNSQGFSVACARRNGKQLESLMKELSSDCRSFSTDARVEADVEKLFKTVEEEMGPVEVVIHNIGGNVRFPLLETTERVYRKVWELCGLSAFLVGREAAKYMTKRNTGTIIFTGATASTRGSANYAAFSGGMFAKRSLAQSMARELGPQGIHVAHVVIDGPIQTEFIKGIFGEESYEERKAAGGLLDPAEIAETYWSIVQQKRTAWTFETDLRPFSETFGF